MEILLLITSMIGIPLICFSLSFSLIFWLIIPGKNNSLLIYFIILFCFVFGLTWNTRLNYGGIGLVSPLKNYLDHRETPSDRFYAQMSSLFILGIILIIYIIFLIYSKFG